MRKRSGGGGVREAVPGVWSMGVGWHSMAGEGYMEYVGVGMKKNGVCGAGGEEGEYGVSEFDLTGVHVIHKCRAVFYFS